LIDHERDGDLALKPHPGRPPTLDKEDLQWIKARVEAKPDSELKELCTLLSHKRGKDVSLLTMCRACQHLDLRRKKKSYYAVEPQRDEVKKRQDSLDTVEEFPAKALIFIDVSGAKLDMCSDYGRTEGGSVSMPLSLMIGVRIYRSSGQSVWWV